jgi:hypothetical protein
VEGVLFVQWWRNRFKWFLHGWLSPLWWEALKGCVWMETWFQRRSKNHSHHHSAVWQLLLICRHSNSVVSDVCGSRWGFVMFLGYK